MTMFTGGRLTHALKTAWANMRADKFSTVIIVLSLALGVATSTFAFGSYETARQYYLLRLPYQPGDVLRFGYTGMEGYFDNRLRPADAGNWAKTLRAEGFRTCSVALFWTNLGQIALVDADAKDFFGLSCVKGAFFSKTDYETGAPVCLAVGGRSEADRLGKEVKIQGRMYRVIGVLANEHESCFYYGYILPRKSCRASGIAMVYARAEGRELQGLKNRWPLFFSDIKYYGNHALPRLTTYASELKLIWSESVSTLAVGSILLFVACLTMANLTAARAARRCKEIGVRKAMGATPGDLAGQLLVENMVLTLAGGLIGLIVYLFYLGAYRVFGAEHWALYYQRFDLFILLYAMIVTVLAGGSASLLPSWRLALQNPITAMRSE